MAATWIFPLAILLSLPYDSLYRNRISNTLAALSNWLGSPQTALTTTIFNFRQMRDCHQEVQGLGTDSEDSHYLYAAYYVLSCFNQFDGLQLTANHNERLRVLVYGLFLPFSIQRNQQGIVPQDIELTRQLLLE
jgi:hypothetical protein